METKTPASAPHDVSTLRQLRDELRLKIHLAEADLKVDWEKAEVLWSRVEGEVNRLRSETKGAGEEVVHGAGALVKELGEAYTRIGAALRRPV